MSATAENAAPAPFPVSASRLQPAGHSFRRWNLVVPAGTRIEDLLEPAFLRLCASQLQSLDIIECVDDGATYYCELLVVSANAGEGVIVKGLRGVELQGASPRGASARNHMGASVEYRGPHLKWCVVKGKQVLRDQFENEAQASAWLANWVRTTRPQA